MKTTKRHVAAGMLASKEEARDAQTRVRSVLDDGRLSDCERNKLSFVLLFLYAAERKLPTAEAYERAVEARRRHRERRAPR